MYKAVLFDFDYMLGDSIVDALAANSAEVEFAGVKTGCCADFTRYKPVFVGKDVLQVFNFVTKE